MLLKYTKFSEIPQFYCDGRLVGGLEILEDMHEQKQLLPVLLGNGKRMIPEEEEKMLAKQKKKKQRFNPSP